MRLWLTSYTEWLMTVAMMSPCELSSDAALLSVGLSGEVRTVIDPWCQQGEAPGVGHPTCWWWFWRCNLDWWMHGTATESQKILLSQAWTTAQIKASVSQYMCVFVHMKDACTCNHNILLGFTTHDTYLLVSCTCIGPNILWKFMYGLASADEVELRFVSLRASWRDFSTLAS